MVRPPNAYSSLITADAKRWQTAFDAGDEEASVICSGRRRVSAVVGLLRRLDPTVS